MKPRTMFITKAMAILAFGLFSFSATQAEEIRVGQVSMARIMSDSAPAKAADAKLKKEFSKREKELNTLGGELKKKVAKLEKDMPVLSQSDRAKRQQELVEQDQEWQQKQRSFRHDLAQRRNEVSADFGKQLEGALKKVAAAEKLDLIVQDALYYSNKVDVTDKVLAELNN